MRFKDKIVIEATHKETFTTTNGVIDEMNLKMAKESLLYEVVRHNTDLVRVINKTYPEDDKIHAELNLSIAILSIPRLRELEETEQMYKALCN